VGVAALEGAVRVRQWLKYGSAAPTVHEFEADPSTGLRIPKPGTTRGGISINSMGFRGPEIAVPKPSGTIRLAFLGASTTYCAEVTGNDVVWPHLVVESLGARFTQVAFDYVNGSVPGYTTTESLKNLESRIAKLDADIVVIYHATNDLSGDTRRLAEASGLSRERPDESSKLAEWSTLWFLIEKNWTVRQRQAVARAGDDRLEFDPSELSAPFRQRLAALVDRAKEIAPVVAVATFSHRIRHDQSSEEKLAASNTSLYYMPYMSVEGLLKGFDEYNRVIREIGREKGVILVESAESIPGDGIHFVDSVHFTDEGSRRMARSIAETLASAAAFTELVSRVEFSKSQADGS
jgi:lysophospholipase L1-like esterase